VLQNNRAAETYSVVRLTMAGVFSGALERAGGETCVWCEVRSALLLYDIRIAFPNVLVSLKSVAQIRSLGPAYLTLRRLMSYIYIYGAPILDVSRSHTSTQHSR